MHDASDNDLANILDYSLSRSDARRSEITFSNKIVGMDMALLFVTVSLADGTGRPAQDASPSQKQHSAGNDVPGRLQPEAPMRCMRSAAIKLCFASPRKRPAD